jgi:hypothetical protein
MSFSFHVISFKCNAIAFDPGEGRAKDIVVAID